MLRIVFIISLFFAAVSHASPARPTHFDQFANAMVAWETLINLARKSQPAELTIRNQEAINVAHLLKPLLTSAEETYATGHYVFTAEGLESGLVRQLLRKALRHLSENRGDDHLLFHLTGMGGILREWGLIDERMQVIAKDLKYPLSEAEASSTLTCIAQILEKRRE